MNLNPRGRAAAALRPVLRQNGSLARSLPPQQQGCAPEDAALVQALAYGTCRWLPRLRWWASQLLQQGLKMRDVDVEALLLVGLYQLQEGRVPAHAAISETVEAAKALRKPWAVKLINACLRRFQREQTSLMEAVQHKEVAALAHPAWLLKPLKKAWPQQWRDICNANNQQPPLTLRVNQRKITREDYLAALDETGLEAYPAPFSAQGIYLTMAVNVRNLPGFDEGWFSVQDEAAQLSAELLDLEDGQRVLDACCAPGGKTAHIAETAQVELTALDSDDKRLTRVHENLTRLDLSAKIQCADAGQLDQWWDQQPFDRILLDAPCSATGVIRRHPDIKALRRPNDIETLAHTQRHLLNTLWATLAPGGKLVYATCSVLPQENKTVVEDFLHQHPDAQALPLEVSWGQPSGAGRQLLPQTEGHDGFFYAVLQKSAPQNSQ